MERKELDTRLRRVTAISHEAALAAKRAGPIAGICAAVDTFYNERPYGERGW